MNSTWAPTEGHWGTLSPEDIIEVQLRASQVGPEELTTYRSELEKQPKIPSLIRAQRAKARREALMDVRRAARRKNLQGEAPAAANGDMKEMSATDRVDAQTREMKAELEAIMEGREPDTHHLK